MTVRILFVDNKLFEYRDVTSMYDIKGGIMLETLKVGKNHDIPWDHIQSLWVEEAK